MTFCIQVSNPRVSKDMDPEDETLDECVETSFVLNTEMALIEWCGVFIPLHYKYTVSAILPDVIIMLNELLEKRDGEIDITWPSNDFNSRWIISWEGDRLIIDAQWNSLIGKTEILLNDIGSLKINKMDFVCEWKALLKTVLNALTECGYSQSNICGLSQINSICYRIEEMGLLYK